MDLLYEGQPVLFGSVIFKPLWESTNWPTYGLKNKTSFTFPITFLLRKPKCENQTLFSVIFHATSNGILPRAVVSILAALDRTRRAAQCCKEWCPQLPGSSWCADSFGRVKVWKGFNFACEKAFFVAEIQTSGDSWTRCNSYLKARSNL